jgi:hypothetical protein
MLAANGGGPHSHVHVDTAMLAMNLQVKRALIGVAASSYRTKRTALKLDRSDINEI